MPTVTIAHRTFAVAALGLVLGCSRPQAAAPPSPATPEATIELFLDAVNANDLDRMATLWGREQGSSAATGEPALEERNQRLAIMQRLLRNDSRRLVSSENTIPTAPVRSYEIVQGERRFVVPFTCVASRHGGWLINQIGLDAAMPTAGPRSR
jgi:hypothetical protein